MSYDYEYYSGVDIEYPMRPRKPVLSRSPTAAEARSYATEIEVYENAKPAHDAEMKNYRAKMAERLASFQQELKQDFNLSDAEFDAVWSLAWDRGHSSGLHEVYCEFADLVTMAIDFATARAKK